MTEDAKTFPLGPFSTRPTVEVVLYDFGAISVSYKIPLQGDLAGFLVLSEALYENEHLMADSRKRVEQLIPILVSAVERPSLSREVEDYLIFAVEEWEECRGGNTPWASQDDILAKILRCERGPLSEQEVKDAISYRLSFAPDDIAIIDWNAAFLFGRQMEDVRAVLEFANVELLEMRLLDHQLDAALDQAYAALAQAPRRAWALLRLPGSLETDSRRIAQLQVDGAILLERVTNTLKLVGDQYLARINRMVSQRFHLEAWDGSITRKLHTLDSIYGKLTDRAAIRRMETLEWIIIVLIAVSIAVSFHS